MNWIISFAGPFLTTLAALLAGTDPSRRDWALMLITAAAAGLGGQGAKSLNAAIKGRKK